MIIRFYVNVTTFLHDLKYDKEIMIYFMTLVKSKFNKQQYFTFTYISLLKSRYSHSERNNNKHIHVLHVHLKQKG